MGITSYIRAIASSIQRKKKQKVGRKLEVTHPIHICTKEQHLKWVKEGKCQCCGDESGEYEGICDECRFS
jgi:hypothetical protein